MTDECHQLPAGLLGRPLRILDLLLPHGPSSLIAREHHRGRQCHDRHD